MEDLVESILDYVRSDYTDYAIMINGEWGVGKTHFWNNKIRKKIESMQLNGKRYTTIYMSLYGISNLEEISKKIFIETTQLMDKNLRKFKRNIIIFYVVVMLFVSLGNALNYAVTIIGLEDARAQAEEQVQNSESIEDEEKTTMIESQNNYVQQVKDVQKETFIIITAIDAILFVIGVIIQFKYTQKYMNDED